MQFTKYIALVCALLCLFASAFAVEENPTMDLIRDKRQYFNFNGNGGGAPPPPPPQGAGGYYNYNQNGK